MTNEITIDTRAQAFGNFVVSEANGYRSRDVLTIALNAGAGKFYPGEVIAKVTASGKHSHYDGDAVDGTETAVGIVMEYVDATAADVNVTCIVRQAEVQAAMLVFVTGQSTADDIPEAIADLRALGIIAR